MTGRRQWHEMAFLAAIGLVLGAGCSGSDRPKGDGPGGAAGTAGDDGTAAAGGTAGNAGTGGSSGAGAGGVGDGPCERLQCQQHPCAGGATTTISGRVFDPAGKNPLYNVAVYVPNSALQPLPQGASCDSCSALFTGDPIAVATTDANGEFTLTNAPDGTDIPLVVQVGKWRRQFTIDNVDQCTDNAQPDGSLRLPRNRDEGDIPNIAVATGGADTLECLLRRVGVDTAEYTPGGGGDGRIHIFRGNPLVDPGGGGGGGGNRGPAPDTSPGAPMASEALWNSSQELMKYDIVLLSCEGEETVDMNQQALHDYASAGGRVFASHFHYSWFNSGPYASENLASWTPGSNSIDDIHGTIVTTLPNGEVFPKGQALFDWLTNVNALENGELPISEARHNADVSPDNTPSQPWILANDQSQAPGATQYFSFNTPTDALARPDGMQFCGRVVYSDLHVGAASGDNPDQPVPSSCADADLSPQEKALEFMLFDLSSCVTPDDSAPPPPVLIGPG